MSNRDRITLLPRDSNNIARMRWHNMTNHITNTAPQWEPLALIACGGMLVRHRQTGRLMEYLSDRLVGVNERKALAALDAASIKVDTAQ